MSRARWRLPFGYRWTLALSSLVLLAVACGRDEDSSGAPFGVATDPGQAQSAPVLPSAKPIAGQSAYALAAPGLSYAHPDLASAPGEAGTLCAVWLAFDESLAGGRDRVVAAIYDSGIWHPPFQVSRKAGIYFPPRVVADPDGGFYFTWAEKTSDGYAIVGRRYRFHGDSAAGAGTLSTQERVSEAGGIDTEPVVVRVDGGLWLAWQSFRDDRFDIFARHRGAGGWGPQISVSDDARSDRQPTLGVDAAGQAWVAWVSWRDGSYATGNYEIYAAKLGAPGASVSPPVRVSDSVSVDMYPEFVSTRQGAALVWTEADFPVRNIDGLKAVAYQRWNDKRYQVAWHSDSGSGPFWGQRREVRVATGVKRAPLPSDRVKPIAGPPAEGGMEGEVWLLHSLLVTRELMDRRWALKLARVDPQTVSAPIDLSMGVAGRGGRFAAAWLDGRLWVAESIDPDGPEDAQDAQGGQGMGQHGPGAGGEPWLRLQQIAPAQLPPRRAAAALEVKRRLAREGLEAFAHQPARGRGRPSPSGGPSWRAYYGNLHSHSDFSRDRRGVNGSPLQAFRSIYDVAELDFSGISDHVEWLLPLDWWELRKATDLWNRPGDFVTLASYEWTSFRYGHRNVFFPDTQVGGAESRFSSFGATPDDLWSFLGDRPSITIPHHPSHGLDEPMDWSFRNDHFQRLVEIFQNRGNYEYDGAPYQRRDLTPRFSEGHSVRRALALGHRMGIIASPDHGGGLGLAGVWAEELSREAIFDALRARRSFGSSGAKMDLFFTVAGHVQGSEFTSTGGPLEIAGSVHATVSGLELSLIADGEEVQSWRFEDAAGSIHWVDERPLEQTRYYYLRAVQGDGHIGWTSPVWVSPKPRHDVRSEALE